MEVNPENGFEQVDDAQFRAEAIIANAYMTANQIRERAEEQIKAAYEKLDQLLQTIKSSHEKNSLHFDALEDELQSAISGICTARSVDSVYIPPCKQTENDGENIYDEFLKKMETQKKPAENLPGIIIGEFGDL